MRLRAICSALGAVLIAGCATQGDQRAAWTVEPAVNVRHGMQDARAAYQLGRHHHQQGRLDEAEAAYIQAININGDDTAALSALGVLYAQRGQLETSVRILERVVSIAPQTPLVHNNLGYALLLAGEHRRAVAVLQRAVQLDVNNRRAWRNLADAYRRLDDLYNAELAEARANGKQPGEAQAPTPAAVPTPVSMIAPERVPMAAMGLSAFGGTSTPSDAIRTPLETRLVRVAQNVYEVRGAPAVVEPSAPYAAAAGSSRPLASIASANVVAPAPSPAAVSAAPSDAGVGRVSVASTQGSSIGQASAVRSPVRPVRYEVTNGHGRNGLARRIATQLHQDGMAFARLTNQRPFNEPESIVQYRKGFREAAEALAARLPFRPRIAAAPSAELVSDVRLLLGRDLDSSEACAELDLCPGLAPRAPGTIVADSATYRNPVN